jgi:hypothetical protein
VAAARRSTPRPRAAAIAAVEDHCRALSQQQPALAPLAFVEAVAAKLRSNAAYAEVGVDTDTLCAWGVFTDGRLHLIANNYCRSARPDRRASRRPTARRRWPPR